MAHDCKYIELIKDTRDDIKGLKKDMRSLLNFKWSTIGGVTVLSFCVSLIVAVVCAWFL